MGHISFPLDHHHHPRRSSSSLLSTFRPFSFISVSSKVNNMSSASASKRVKSDLSFLSKNATAVDVLGGKHNIPLLGFGTWRAEKGLVGAAVEEAIRTGYRHIDCAQVYGNEKEIGDTLSKLFKEGVVKREDLWITSKLWCTEWEHVVDACKVTIADLQCDYLDLYLMHGPVAFERTYSGPHRVQLDKLSPRTTASDGAKVLKRGKTSIAQCWHQMEQLKDLGLARTIGISNFNCPLIADLLVSYKKYPPQVHQLEVHPYLTCDKINTFCAQNDIHVTCYSTLGGGYQGPLQDATVAAIAKTHKATPAQVLIRWAMQHGYSVLPKSVTPSRIRENFEVFGFELSQAEMTKLDGLNCNKRLIDQESFHAFPYYD